MLKEKALKLHKEKRGKIELNPKVSVNTKEDLSSYHGFIIPGGFSYEDRIRAGVVAAKQKILEKVRNEAESGKLLLGICNGAQILFEPVLFPENTISTGSL